MRTFGRLLLAAATIGATASVAVTPAEAASLTHVTLTSHYQSITTSTGKSLHLQLIATRSGTQTNASVSLTKGSGANTEQHVWSFDLTGSSLTYDKSTGKGVFATGTQLGPFGAVKLTFKKTKSSTANCAGGGTATTVRGTLSGSISFVTKSTSWGKFSKKTYSFDTPNLVSYQSSDCAGPGGGGTPACFTGTSWTAPFTGTVYAFGSATTTGGTTTSTIIGQKSVKLAKPDGATRLDLVQHSEPKPTLSGETLTVKTGTGTIKGSATLTGGTPFAQESNCKSGGTTTTQTTTTHLNTTWSSTLVFNQQAFADFNPAATGTSSWTQFSFGSSA